MKREGECLTRQNRRSCVSKMKKGFTQTLGCCSPISAPNSPILPSSKERIWRYFVIVVNLQDPCSNKWIGAWTIFSNTIEYDLSLQDLFVVISMIILP